MLKLVDKPDLGSGALRVWVRVPSPAPQRKRSQRWPLSFVMFEVPQRQQLSSERTSLTLFAPVLKTGFYGTKRAFGA